MLMGQRNNTVSHLNFFLLMNDKNIAILPVLEARAFKAVDKTAVRL